MDRKNPYARDMLNAEEKLTWNGGRHDCEDRQAGQRKKGIEEVVSYAVGHRTRVHILIVLNEGTFTPGQIAEVIGEPLNNVSNHVRELLDAGSIELASQTGAKHSPALLPGLEMPDYYGRGSRGHDPGAAAGDRRTGVQSMVAEVMAATLGREPCKRPAVWLAWDWFNVDGQGREDIADDRERSWGPLSGDRGRVHQPPRPFG